MNFARHVGSTTPACFRREHKGRPKCEQSLKNDSVLFRKLTKTEVRGKKLIMNQLPQHYQTTAKLRKKVVKLNDNNDTERIRALKETLKQPPSPNVQQPNLRNEEEHYKNRVMEVVAEEDPRIEVIDAFECYVADHLDHQQAMYIQMMAAVRNMYARAPYSTPADQLNRISLATLNNLVHHLTSHQRLVTSLICDVAEGRINKGVPQRKRLPRGPPPPPKRLGRERNAGGVRKSTKKRGRPPTAAAPVLNQLDTPPSSPRN